MMKDRNARDTQFQGFAHALLLQLAEENALALNWENFFGDLELTVARRAYDLVFRTLAMRPNSGDPRQTIRTVQDMPELPKEKN